MTRLLMDVIPIKFPAHANPCVASTWARSEPNANCRRLVSLNVSYDVDTDSGHISRSQVQTTFIVETSQHKSAAVAQQYIFSKSSIFNPGSI